LRDEDGARRIEWPTTQASTLALPGRDLVVIAGPEPNYRWRKIIGQVVDVLAAAEPELVVLLGAMLSDAPHTRHIPVTATTENPQLAQELELAGSDYEGPTGIVGALAAELEPAGWPTVTVWASVPHYVSEPPNPKATLALLTKLEEILGTPLDSADLFAQAEAWSEQVSELVEENPEIGEYISALEERRDKDTPPPTADSIAAEFERYLRRRDARS
ncbi:MAG: PAC2 family protein, partial [Propionibacteriaceae bacterium]|nr:PAC2 family protein [Propionibacteriaceae bacterium]